jgi:hypothetical protein
MKQTAKERECIAHATSALEAWIYESNTHEDESNLRDLLCDLLHLAASKGMSLKEELSSALMNFEHESNKSSNLNYLNL